MISDLHTPEQLAEHELFLLSRESRPWQDDVHLIDVLRTIPEPRKGNAITALPLAVVLSAALWALLWWLA
jgi:hypothetical protein